jgi:hypothetical protein
MEIYMTTTTRLVGRINFDNALLDSDLKTLSNLPAIKEQYDEFGSGTWINHSLWNRTGEWTDAQPSGGTRELHRTILNALIYQFRGPESPRFASLVDHVQPDN